MMITSALYLFVLQELLSLAERSKLRGNTDLVSLGQ